MKIIAGRLRNRTSLPSFFYKNQKKTVHSRGNTERLTTNGALSHKRTFLLGRRQSFTIRPVKSK